MRPEDLALANRTLDVPGDRAPIEVTWLGTAGFAIEHEGTAVLVDPYVTRASMWDCLRRPLASDEKLVARYAPRASAIVAGHTHFDHALDVPAIARATGARVYGSRSCVHLCRVAGVPEAQVFDVESAQRAGEPVRAEVGPFELRFVPSVHSAFALGRVPFPGDISDCDQLPLTAARYRCGAVFGLDLRAFGKRIYHLGSANLLDAHPEPDVDLLLMCVAGWTSTERFAPRVMSAFRPETILLSHWDDFFAPLAEGARMLPAMQMPHLVDSLTALEPSVTIATLPFLGSLRL